MTKGEKTVRIHFNSENIDEVSELKAKFAELIDYIDSKSKLDGRLASITITKLEEACMFGVKLLTTDK